jgi:hypothetical protein
MADFNGKGSDIRSPIARSALCGERCNAITTTLPRYNPPASKNDLLEEE